MTGSHPSRWIMFLIAGALGAFGCVGTTDSGQQGETGSLSLDLVLADGTLIDEVDWQITGNGMDMSGTVDVSAPGSTASVEVFGLPKGEEDYTIALEAVSVDREVSCRGSEPFNVEPGETTDVMVILNCKLPQRLGAVRVNGKFNICAELIKAVVSPLQTSVGNDIDLASQAVDQEGDPITFTWTATGGTIADPAAASTTYTCVDVGDHFVNISVTDNDEACDMAEWTIPVTCVEGDGGTGGSGGDGGTGGQGGAGGEAGAGGQGGAGGEAGAGGGTGGEGGAGGGIDPDIVCNEGVCLTDAGKKAECVAFLVDCLENNSDLNDDECVIGALLICEPDPCDTIDCSDSNECTDDLCADGVCSNPPVMDGNMCDGTAGVCESGVCVPADLCVGKDCSDGNECTQDLCDPETGICSNPNETDGTSCTCPVCGAEGVCMMGECVDPCEGVDCSDGNQCTADLCDLGVCSNPNVGPGGACDQDGGVVCDGSGNCAECVDPAQCPAAGECQVATCIGNTCGTANDEDGAECDGGAGTCQSGTCEAAADSVVCQQFNPAPAQTGQNCDGSAGQECICEKAEFIAIDCELVGNSAPLPVNASAQQFGVAFAGTAITILPEDAISLPASLVCGFIGAGFADALVADSDIEATYTNADITSSALSSFLATASSGGDLVSPHGDVFFDFGTACGDNCTGPLGSETCESSGDPCTPATFTEDCSEENGGTVGTGPGIEAPFFANAPGSIPPGPIPAQLVSLTPTAAGSVDIGLPYSGIALNLPDVGGLVSGCVGGACTAAKVCTPILRGTETSPRVMYDAVCSKPASADGTCSPFEDFTTTADVCKQKGLEPPDLGADNIPPCCDNTLPCVAPCAFLPTDLFCVTPANVASCCAAIATDYPSATPAQLPQLWVNP